MEISAVSYFVAMFAPVPVGSQTGNKKKCMNCMHLFWCHVRSSNEALEQALELTALWTDCSRDPRPPKYMQHTLGHLTRH